MVNRMCSIISQNILKVVDFDTCESHQVHFGALVSNAQILEGCGRRYESNGLKVFNITLLQAVLREMV